MTPADQPADPLQAATHADPYPYYAQLTGQRPVYFDKALSCWVISNAVAVAQVLEHPRCKMHPAGQPVPPVLQGSRAGTLFGHLVRMHDSPDPETWKLVAVGAFESIEQRELDAIASEAAYRTASITLPTRRGQGLVDYCYQVPSQAIALLLGLSQAVVMVAARLTSLAVRCISPGGTPGQIAAGREATALLWQILEQVLELAVPDRGRGGLRALRHAAVQSGAGRDAVIADAIGLMIQTFEVTSGLIGNALLALSAADAGDLGPAAVPGGMNAFVREVLRHDPPIQNTRRFAWQRFCIADHTVEAGHCMLLLLAAANRDPMVNPAAHVFDPLRPQATLFSSGRAPHQRAGQRLAEAIAAAALRELLARGLEPRCLLKPVRYRWSVSARVPELQLAVTPFTMAGGPACGEQGLQRGNRQGCGLPDQAQ